MPVIPLIQSERGNTYAAPSPEVSADAFGAGIGRATAQLGATLTDAGASLGQFARKEKNIERAGKLANADAQAEIGANKVALDVQAAAPPDGAGVAKQTEQQLRENLNKQADEQFGPNGLYPDPQLRQQMITRGQDTITRHTTNAQNFEQKQKINNSAVEANTSLDALQNTIRGDATSYDSAIKKGDAVIDTLQVPAGLKPNMKITWRQQAARARFEGLLSSATTTEEVDQIIGDLTGGGAEGKTPIGSSSEYKPGDIFLPDGTKVDYHMVRDEAGLKPLLEAEAAGKQLLPEEKAQIVAYRKWQKTNAVAPKNPQYVATPGGGEVKGMIVPGNIDLLTRPRVKITAENRLNDTMEIGSVSTVYSSSYTRDDGKTVLIPLVSDEGKLMHTPEAREYWSKKGQNLGVFNSKEAADAYSEELHKQQEKMIAGSEEAPAVAGGSEWRTQFDPKDYDRMLDAAKVAKTSIQSKDDVAARAALEDLGAQDAKDQKIDEEEIRAANQLAKKSGNPITHLRMARLQEHQQLIRDFEGTTPIQKRAAAGRTLGEASRTLPADLAEGVNQATRLYPDVSSSYMVATTNREYSSYNAKRGPEGAIDYTRKNPASGATGPYQFISSTWLSVMKANNGLVARQAGVDPELLDGKGNHDARLLGLRADPKVAAIAGAAYASSNKKMMESAIGRSVTDGDMYVSHFLGPGGAITLIHQMQTDPNTSAAQILPQAAGSNHAEFYNKDGSPRTVQQLYNRLVSQFGGSTSAAGYRRAEDLTTSAEKQDKSLNEDPISEGRKEGITAGSDLNADNGYRSRGLEARNIASYFHIPESDMKPFTKDEASLLSENFKNGSEANKLALMTKIQEMDAGFGGKNSLAKAAYAQLGLKGSVYEYAAALAANQGNQAVASQIVRGQQRLDADDAAKKLFEGGGTFNDYYNTAIGNVLRDFDPKDAEAIKRATAAYYAQMPGFSTSTGGNIDQASVKTALQAVLGGSQVSDAIDDVNGEPTVLPRGITADGFNRAIDNFTNDDYVVNSASQLPPRYSDGTTIIDAGEIAREGHFRWIGGSGYRIELGDNTYATTGRPDPVTTGVLEPYIFIADPSKLAEAATRGKLDVGTVYSAPPPPQRTIRPEDVNDPMSKAYDPSKALAPPQ